MADCKSAETPSGTEGTYPTGRKLIKFKIDEWLKSEERPDPFHFRPVGVAEKINRSPCPLPDVVETLIEGYGALGRVLRRGPSRTLAHVKQIGIFCLVQFIQLSIYIAYRQGYIINVCIYLPIIR